MTDPRLSDDDFEALGQMVGKLANFACGAIIPMPLEIHRDALKGCIEDVRDEMRAWLIGKGFNPWSDE